jgi:beta-phosphoglucomutase-like phosphatase (HAD superfamily)
VRLCGDGQLTLRPGVARLIHEARAAGLRLAIATTTARANVEALLATRLGPEAVGWFEVIGAGKMVARQKPAPDVYQYVLRHLNLPAAQCLAFEDSIFGLTSARGAGLTTVVTQSLYTTAHDFTGAALVLDHLGEPDQPFTVQAGDAAGHRWFDVALARHIHRQANRL